jgi:hypothetical protein
MEILKISQPLAMPRALAVAAQEGALAAAHPPALVTTPYRAQVVQDQVDPVLLATMATA